MFAVIDCLVLCFGLCAEAETIIHNVEDKESTEPQSRRKAAV